MDLLEPKDGMGDEFANRFNLDSDWRIGQKETAKKNQKVFLLQKNPVESAALCSKRLRIRLPNPTIITSIEKNGKEALIRYRVSFIFIFLGEI